MADDSEEQSPHSSVSSLSTTGGNFVTVTENDLTDSISWSSASGSTELLKTREKSEFTTADDASSATATTTTVPASSTLVLPVAESEDNSQTLVQSETSSSSPSLSGFLEPPDSPSIVSDDGSIHMVNAETISPIIVSPASSLEGSHEEEDGDNVIVHKSRSESESRMRESRGEERSPQFTPTVITRNFIPGEAHADNSHLTRSVSTDKSQPRGRVNILFQPQHRQSLVAQLNEGTHTREIIKDHILKPFLQGFALGMAAHLYRYLRSGRTSVAGVWKRNLKST